MNEVSLLFEKLFSSLNLRTSASDLEFLGKKYSFIDYNIYQFVGDLADYNIAHLIVPAEAIGVSDDCYPLLGKLKNRHHYCIVDREDEENLSIYCPWDSSIQSVHFSALSSVLDKWVVLMEPTVFTKLGKTESFFDRYKGYLLALLTAIIAGFTGHSYGIASLLLVTLCLAGIYICYELFQQKTGKSSGWVQGICSKSDGSNSCDKVINSAYSNFLGFVPLYYLGGFYFLGFLLYLLINFSIVGSFLPTILCVAVNLIALFFGFVFVFLQIFILKNICFLCTLIFVLILSINGVLYGYEVKDIYDIFPVLLSALLSIGFLWVWDKYTMFQSQTKSLKIKLYKWLTDNHVFQDIHKNLKPVIKPDEARLLINYDEGKRRIDLLISDTCSFCEAYFKEIMKLLVLSDDYYVAIHLESEKEINYKLAWLHELLANTVDNYGDYFTFTIRDSNNATFNDVKLTSLIDSVKRNERRDLISNSISNKTNFDSYPLSFLDQALLNNLYDAKAIKRQLILLKYK